MPEFLNTFLHSSVEIIFRVLGVILVLAVGLRLAKVASRKFHDAKANEHMDPTARGVISKLILWGIRAIVIVTVCALLNIPTASVIAVISSVGLAVGLGLQGGLSNIAGGVMIILFRPFRLGDCITSGDYTGTVTDIGLIYTTITTPDNRSVAIPNGTLTGATIVNYSREEKRRVDLDFSVAYASDIELVRKVMLAAAVNHAMVLDDPAPEVLLTEHGESALVFRLRAWCKNADYWTVYFELTEDVKRAFDQFRIEIPFPQMDVHVVEKK